MNNMEDLGNKPENANTHDLNDLSKADLTLDDVESAVRNYYAKLLQQNRLVLKHRCRPPEMERFDIDTLPARLQIENPEVFIKAAGDITFFAEIEAPKQGVTLSEDGKSLLEEIPHCIPLINRGLKKSNDVDVRIASANALVALGASGEQLPASEIIEGLSTKYPEELRTQCATLVLNLIPEEVSKAIEPLKACLSPSDNSQEFIELAHDVLQHLERRDKGNF